MPEAERQDTTAPRTVGERWELVEPLAEGGMGAVWIARHNVTGRRVALKLLERFGADASSVERFRREAAVTTELGHPGIVEVLDAGLDPVEETFFIAMELLEGATLQDKLEDPCSTPAEILGLIHRMLEPLAAAHARGVIHRDMKPANVFIVRDAQGERPKLLDFGIAKQSGNSRMTATGTAMGTPYYMSPEQALDARRVSAASDIWSVGVIIYEALTGCVPFDGSTPHGVIVAACTEPHTSLLEIAPNMDPALSALVDRCLEKDPAKRPANASILAQELAPLVRISAVPEARVPSRAPSEQDPRESSRVRPRPTDALDPAAPSAAPAPLDLRSTGLGLAGAACLGGAIFLAVAGSLLSLGVVLPSLLGVALLVTAAVLARANGERRRHELMAARQGESAMPARATLRPPARGKAS
ncbi:MAG: serine/threonine protein kinase, partial [Deltaproteobacteria bacterium]|nr:serine/threonine protein kinase [Deltaproteobacteria bacterium]